jgi:uncharacterized protein
MNYNQYYPRILDSIIETALQYKSCVYLKGLKYTGKTTTCLRFAKTSFDLLRKRDRESMKLALGVDSSIVFSLPKPIFIDEIQKYPPIWDEVKSNIDLNKGVPNQFILSGSTAIKEGRKEENRSHTGTGRFKELIMRPMSLFESMESNGSISLKELFAGQQKINGIKADLPLAKLIYATCRGGFPNSLKATNDELALEVAKDYVDDIVSKDISDVDGCNRNRSLAKRFLHCYAKNTCTLAKNTKVAAEIRGNDFSFSDVSYYDYKKALESLFVIEDVEAWSPLMKSKASMYAIPKKNLADPSLAIASLSLTPAKLAKNLYDYGFFFESLCIRDLRIYSSSFGGEVSYYHDRNGLECDAVLTLNDGRYALIEIKLGEGQIKEAEDHLLKIKEKINAYNSSCQDPYMKMEMPSLLIVLVGSETAYDLPSGVKVVPIGCLRD